MSRLVAFVEWALAAAILIWAGVFQLTSLAKEAPSWTLGVVITSTFIALGVALVAVIALVKRAALPQRVVAPAEQMAQVPSPPAPPTA